MTTDAISHAINEVVLISSGDFRLPSNQTCWPAQEDLGARLAISKHVLRDYEGGLSETNNDPISQ